MPHLIVEYSSNLDAELNITDVLEAVHDAALETGVFPLAGLRTRAERRDKYLVADKHPDNSFVHLIARIGEGRDDATKQKAGDTIFAALTKALQPAYDKVPMAVGFEFVEINTWKQGNIRDYLVEREA